MGLRNRIVISSAWQMIAYAVSAIIGVVTTGLLTRHLGENGFGQYVTVILFGSMVTAVSDLGLTILLTRELARDREQGLGLFHAALGFRLVASALIAVIIVLASPFLPYDRPVRVGIGLFAMATVLSGMTVVIGSLFRATLRMADLAVSEIVGRVISLLAIIWVVRAQQSLFTLILMLVVTNAVQLGFTALLASRLAAVRFNFDFTAWRGVIVQAAPFAAVVVLSVAHGRIDGIILSVLRNPSQFPDMGIHGAANRVLETLAPLSVAIVMSIFPMLARTLQSNSGSVILASAARALSILIWPIFLGGILLADQIMAAVTGPAFAEPRQVLLPLIGSRTAFPAGIALQLLMFAFLFMCIGYLNGQSLVAVNAQAVLLRISLYIVALDIALNLFLIPQYGFVGAGLARVCSEGIGCWLSARALGARGIAYPWRELGASVFPAGGMATVVTLVWWGGITNLIALVLLGALSYSVLWFAFRRKLTFEVAAE